MDFSLETALRDELRTELLSFLTDSCDIYQKISTTSDSRGGVSSAWSKIHDNVPCRIQSLRMKVSMGEQTVGQKPRAEDECIIVLPYDYQISNSCELDITTRDGLTARVAITQQMEQSDALTRVFSGVRIT